MEFVHGVIYSVLDRIVCGSPSDDRRPSISEPTVRNALFIDLFEMRYLTRYLAKSSALATIMKLLTSSTILPSIISIQQLSIKTDKNVSGVLCWNIVVFV
jgi:hypothetical protein